MTLEMGILLGALVVMAFLFFTEKLPVELTAFIGLVFLVFMGYVKPSEAFTGFSSPAVITMLSIFFVSAALQHTGVADVIAGKVHKLLGNREVLLVVAIMLVSGALSAFMNNIAAVAVLLPAVSSISKKSEISPSRLFMPLSFGAILGGTTTLVGTPPNIIAADIMRERGLESFSLFDFTPIGLILLGCGILYMITIGRYFLPNTKASRSDNQNEDLAHVYHLDESLFSIRIPKSSAIEGKTLAECKFGSTLGVQVIGIIRDGKKQLAPGAETQLKSDDVLLVEGPYDKLKKMFRVQGLQLGDSTPEELESAFHHIKCVAARIPNGSSFIGKTLRDIDLRKRFGAVVIAIRHKGQLIDTDLAGLSFEEEDELIALGTRSQLEKISEEQDLDVVFIDPKNVPDLRSHLFVLKIHAGSPLVGSSIRESRIGELVGLTIAGIIRKRKPLMATPARETIRSGDHLLVAGDAQRIHTLTQMGDVQLKQEIAGAGIQSDDVGMVEVTLSPRSRAEGRSLSQIAFREKTGLQVLAICSKGHAIHNGLASHILNFGDAFLVQGSWSKIRALGENRDFVVLTPSAQEHRRTSKAPIAIGALVLMIVMVATGYMPVHVASFAAATFVALFGAITMEEAYRSVEWKAVFLVAAILPVGIAIERTGAASLVSQAIIEHAGPLGAYGVLTGFVVLSSVLSQALDGAPAVVLMAPVVIPAAAKLGLSTNSVMMATAVATSVAFMTPFSQKTNLIIMGVGGYRFSDYLKVGTPLTIILTILTVILVPIFFPF